VTCWHRIVCLGSESDILYKPLQRIAHFLLFIINKDTATLVSQIPLIPFEFKYLRIKFRQSRHWTDHTKCQCNEVWRVVSHDSLNTCLPRHVINVHATLIPEPEIACAVVNTHYGFSEIAHLPSISSDISLTAKHIYEIGFVCPLHTIFLGLFNDAFSITRAIKHRMIGWLWIINLKSIKVKRRVLH
jgi:hypothetical protein